MPFRSRETLEGWLVEFQGLGFAEPERLRVIQQDGAGGANTGLVALAFADSATTAYIQPVAPGDPRWVMTLESREQSVELDAAGVAQLASELTVAAALVAFLQGKSVSLLEQLSGP